MYTYDTETSNDGCEAWIWSWALCSEQMDVRTGNGLDVMSIFGVLEDGAEVWVHNLPYDGEFLTWELHAAGYKLRYDVPPMDRQHGVYTILSDTSGIISMDVYTLGRRVTLRDSNRIFRAPLRKLPKICGFAGEVTKGELDYEPQRPRDHVKTPEELDYQVRDVKVLMRAMLWVRSHADEGNTIGSIAVHEWRSTLGNKSPFDPLTLDQRVAYRSLYNGGIVYCPPAWAGKLRVGAGRVYDRNSMYPAEMIKPLPVRIIERVHGSAPISRPGCWALHVQAQGLQLKHDGFPLLITPFTGSGRSSIDVLERWLYDEELQAITEEYNIKSLKVIGALHFDEQVIAADFVAKWYRVKSTEPERRSYAKYVLNNLSGKWGESPIHEQVRRTVAADGSYVQYRYNDIDKELNRWAYMPAVARVTSNSRLQLRDAVIKSGRTNLWYTDTDSVHTTGELPADMIDPVRLGAWDLETTFDAARYIKPKSYWESADGVTVSCKHAGVNDDATLALWDDHAETWIDTGEQISALNMRSGAHYYTRRSRKCKGGIIIERSPKIM